MNRRKEAELLAAGEGILKPKTHAETMKTYRERQKARGFEECIVWIPIGTKPEIQALAKKLREAK